MQSMLSLPSLQVDGPLDPLSIYKALVEFYLQIHIPLWCECMQQLSVKRAERERKVICVDATWVFDQRERTDRMLLYKGCPVGAVKLPYFPLEKK